MKVEKLYKECEKLIQSGHSQYDVTIEEKINMTKEEIEKRIYFAEMLIGVINHVERPILMYEEEKKVVKEALSDYKYKLESELRGKII